MLSRNVQLLNRKIGRDFAVAAAATSTTTTTTSTTTVFAAASSSSSIVEDGGVADHVVHELRRWYQWRDVGDVV